LSIIPNLKVYSSHRTNIVEIIANLCVRLIQDIRRQIIMKQQQENNEPMIDISIEVSRLEQYVEMLKRDENTIYALKVNQGIKNLNTITELLEVIQGYKEQSQQPAPQPKPQARPQQPQRQAPAPQPKPQQQRPIPEIADDEVSEFLDNE